MIFPSMICRLPFIIKMQETDSNDKSLSSRDFFPLYCWGGSQAFCRWYTPNSGGVQTMIQAYGLDIPRTLEDLCDPRRMALLVYDMQVGILSQIKNGAEITTRVLKVLGAARESGIRVIFSRHMSLPKELMGVFQMRMAMAWQRVETVEEVKPWFIRDSPGFHL